MTGTIGDYTFEELQQVRIGAMMGMEDQPLCTFEQVCQLYTKYPGIVILVDLKPNEDVEGTVKPVMEIVKKYGLEERVMYNSLDGHITKWLKDNTDFVIMGPPEGDRWGVNQTPGLDGTYATLDSVCVPSWELTLDGCNYLKSIGKIVISAPVADEESAKRCLETGVEIALADNPVHLLKMLGRMK